MCDLKDEAKTKAERLIIAMERVADRLEALIADPVQLGGKRDAGGLGGATGAGDAVAVNGAA